MAVAFRAAGAASSGTTAVTPGLPAGHVSNDILLCFVQTANENAGSVPTNSTSGTWVEITNSPQGIGSGAGSVGLRVYWMRDAGAAIGTVTVPDSGNHTIAQICAYSGCVTSGNPWSVTFGWTLAGTQTSIISPTSATQFYGGSGTLVVCAAGHAVDSASAQLSGWTNPSSIFTGSFVEETAADSSTTSGTGGGFGIADITITGSGAIAASTTIATVGSTSNQANMLIHLRPATVPWIYGISASLSFSGSLVKAVRRALAGALSFVGATTKRTSRAVTGALSFVGAAAKCAKKTFSGTLQSGGTATTLTSGLQVHYKLEDLTDSSGNAMTLTNNNVVTFIAGKVNNAAHFVAASSQGLIHADASPFQRGTGDFSIACWFKAATGDANRRNIAVYGAPIAALIGYGFWRWDEALQCTIGDGTHQVRIEKTSGVFDSQWHLAIGVFSRAGNMDFYVDNTSVGSSDITAVGSVNDSGGFFIAEQSFIADAYFGGDVDEFRLYDRTLTSAERTEMWNSGSGTTGSGGAEALTKKTLKALSSALSFVGAQTKYIRHYLTATLSFIGNFTAARAGTLFLQALTGTLSFSGSFTKSTLKALSGALSFVGAVTKSTARALTGSVSFSGLAIKQCARSLSGACSFVGSFTKRTNKALSGALSFVGALTKSTAHTLTGSVSFVGSTVKTCARSLSGACSFAGSFTKQTNKALAGALSFVGSAVKTCARSLSGACSFVGSFTKQTNKAIAGAVSFVGSAVKQSGKALSAACSFGGSFTKRTSRALAGVLSFVGQLDTLLSHVGQFFLTLNSSLDFSGSITKRTSRLLAATSSFTGSCAKSSARAVSATLSFTGTLTKRTAKALAGVLSFVGVLATQLTSAGTLFLKSLSATLEFNGAITKHILKELAGSLPFAGAATKICAKAVSATLSFTGSISKGIRLSFSGVLSFVGQLDAGNFFYVALSSTLSFAGSLTKRTRKAFDAVLDLEGAIARQIGKALYSTLCLCGRILTTGKLILDAVVSVALTFDAVTRAQLVYDTALRTMLEFKAVLLSKITGKPRPVSDPCQECKENE